VPSSALSLSSPSATGMDRYEVDRELGSGMWGKVYRARKRESGEVVAIKRINQPAVSQPHLVRGVNFTALREIRYLKELRHENIVLLHDALFDRGELVLVFEFLYTDLEKFIRDTRLLFNATHVSCMMQQLLRGVGYCHSRHVLHRDLKPSNLLMNDRGVMKLADFGLARYYGSPNRAMTYEVITICYRPPELLFGARHYSAAVDLWAAGCIFAEMMLRRIFLPGRDEPEQLGLIFQMFGTPTEDNWPGASLLPKYVAYEASTGMGEERLASVFRFFPAQAFDLLMRLLRMAPGERLGAADALGHDFFRTSPPCDPNDLPRPAR